MSRLLILDNSPAQQESLVGAGLDAGFERSEITVAAGIAEALASFERPFDVAVVDLHLGEDFCGDDSLGFIKRLRETFPKCWIIGFTTKLDNTMGALSIAYGANDFVSGKWRTINYYNLLIEKMSIYKALAEGVGFPISTQA